MFRYYTCFIFFIIFSISRSLVAQCTIQGTRNGCVNDIITFTINSSTTPSAYNWNFGSYGNSSNSAPSIKVTATGDLLVTCTLTLSGGATCVDTHLLKIHANPTGKLEIDPSSVLCATGNKICLKNASIKADAEIERITLLWYDGSITKTQKPLQLLCRSFAGAGTYTYSMEVADDFGCKHTTNGSVVVNPNPRILGIYKVTDYCDSIRFCFDGESSGGTSFTYEWFSSTGQALSTDKVYCKTLKAGESATFRCKVTNNFGCVDTRNFYGNAPNRKLSGSMDRHKFCKSEVDGGYGYFGANQVLQWTLNGLPKGYTDTFRLSGAKQGWNYVSGKQSPPCTGELVDSFFVTEVTAGAIAFNVDRIKVIDTCFFLDMTRASPGTKLVRWWSFNDPAGQPCTTNTKYNIHAWENCNYSMDSLARHYYHMRECFTAKLYVMDSISGCSSDTVINVFRYDFCDSFIKPKIVCLGDPVSFRMSMVSWKKASYYNVLYTDINLPRKQITLNPPSVSVIYDSVGYKSPIFARNYGDEIVWKDSFGIIVVDSIRKVGWVSDTFFNGVLVKYRPNSNFALSPLPVCPPYKVNLYFQDTAWSDPDTMIVDWGDTIIYYTGYTSSIAALDTLTHVYAKSGIYRIVVKLKPKLGCNNESGLNIGIGTSINFVPQITCNWKWVCFADDVVDMSSGLRWDVNIGKLYWDFGNGKKDSGFNKCAKFPSPGKYKITMWAKSMFGCTDSLTKEIILEGAVAAMKEFPLIYCSQIHTFYDSSWVSGTGDKIKSWSWNFGDGTIVQERNPAHIYPLGGKYTVTLIITTEKGCKDTVYQDLKVIGPQVYAYISTDSSGCPPLRIQFENGSKQTGNFIWQFKDPGNNIYSTLEDTSVSFVYTKPGIYYAKLIGGDSFYNPNTGSRYFCSVTYPKGDTALKIEVYPNATTDFAIPDSVCLNRSFEIPNTSPVKTKEYTWKYMDSIWSDVPYGSVFNQYFQTGSYPIGLFPEIDSADKLCPDSMWKMVKVVNHYTRFFTDCKLSKAPSIYLRNATAPTADIYRWTEMDPMDSSEADITYSRDANLRFDLDTGVHVVCLSSRDSAYCLVKTCTTLVVNNYIALSNVFTPGTDGYNDVFKVPFGGYRDYEFVVFNRYGERIFKTTNSSEYWNGKVNNAGAQLPSGNYFYQLSFQEECKTKRTFVSGSITLLR